MTICTPGVAGPFTFEPMAGPPTDYAMPVGCMTGVGPPNNEFAFITLYITTSGPLDLLIEGNTGVGFLDVVVYNIPPGEAPCDAVLNPANEIGCNYASTPTGCVQFGTAFPCASSVPAPFVNAGDVLTIIVNDYDIVGSDDFTMELGPTGAQTGPPDATITALAPICNTDPAIQLNAVDMGGTWSGTGVSPTGMFDPAAAGPGTFTITYTIGNPPCQSTDTQTFTVINCSTPCSITSITAVPSACNPATNNYSVSGTISITNPPASGTLTVTTSCGGSQVFSAPFAASIAYNITGLTSNGAACTVTAVFSADPGCTNTQNYTAPASCISTCLITFFNANISAPTCGAVGGTYGITGNVNTSSAPATGTLTVSSTCGGTQVFSAPFAASIAYSLTGIPANGAACTVTAVYSADPGCTQSIAYTAPTCPCNMDNLFVNIGACDGPTNTYEVDIDLDFSSPPATGTLTIDVCGTVQTFLPPFTSPMTVNFTGLPTGVGSCTVTCSFSASPGCTTSLTYTAPSDCSCPADAGTYTTTATGSGTTDYVLCFGDQIDIAYNGDGTPPQDLSDPTTAYNPGVWILIYACPPTPGMDILADPCFLGVSPFTDDFGNMTDVNDLLIINSYPTGTFTDNTVYYVPITMYDVTTGIYSLYPPPDLCFDLGAPIPVTYLPDITATGVENCAAGTVTVTVNGGHPEIFGTNFTASNLLPATASFVNTTCGNGGTIVISGLDNGDMYSFDITDANGCPFNFSGGPFVGPTTPVINPAGPFCTADPATNLTASIGGGTWTATCGACITAAGSFNPATAGVGTFTVTYTLPGCSTPATASVTVQNLSITSITPTDVTCFGLTDGSITINSPGATSFSIDNGLTFQASNVFTNVAAGAYNIVVQSAGGCSANGTTTVNSPTAVTAIPGGNDESCFGACDGFAVVAPGGGTAPYTFSWTGPVTGTTALLSDLCSGTYNVTVTDDNGCTATASQVINGPVAVTITGTPMTPPSCNGGANGSITVNATGTAPFTYSNNGGTSFQVSNIFNSLTAGTYNIIAQDANGCTATTTVIVTQPTPVTVTSSADVTICIGQSTTISVTPGGGTGPYNFVWDHGLPNLASHSVTPATSPDVYNVSVTDANGCGPALESITVTLNPPLAVTANTSQSVCPGDCATITATGATGGDGNYTYTWTNNIDGTVLSGANQTVCPTVQTDYTITITDGCGTPAAQSTITIGIFALPAISYGPYTSQGCAPWPVAFNNLTNAGASATCLWDFGDGTTSTNCDPTHVFTTPGCYDVSLSMVTSDGCAIDTLVNDNVCVFAVPTAEFTFGPQPTDIFNTEIDFSNLSIGGVTYDWDFAGLGSSTLINPTFAFPVDSGGTYKVCLETVNSNNCYDSTCHFVVIDEVFLIYVPNAFTPEGDGTNEIFLPILQGEDPFSYELFIFNRWGEVIFQSNNKQIGWDGTHKGMKSKEDVYVWKIRVKKKAVEEHLQYIGHVTLLR